MGEHRILVVDDDPLMVKLLQATLENRGFDVLVATDGQEGLDTIKDEHPDLVVSDIMMPKVDGFELVQRLRADPMVGNTPVVILSAKGEEEDLVKGLELGADDYVTKPFRPNEFVARLQTILRRRGALAQGIRPSAEAPFSEEGLQHLSQYTFENFVTGIGNRSAYEAALASAENPGTRFNPLFLYGGPGLGKTHLMCSLATRAHQKDKSIKVQYLSSETFSQQVLEAYRARSTADLRERYLSLDILIIDDIQFLAISPSLQHVAADILSDMYDQGKQIVISSDRRPEAIATLSGGIATGLGIGLVVEVDHPDASLRSRILRFKAEQNAWPLERDLLDHLASHLESDVRTLEGVAKRLVAMNALSGIPLDTQAVDDLISEVTRSEEDEAPPPEQTPSRFEEFLPGSPRVDIDIAEEEKQADDRLPEYEDPLAEEFHRSALMIRTTGLPEDVAFRVPHPGIRSVVIVGNSRALVVDTIEALAARNGESPGIPEGDRWAYMLHVDNEKPEWLLVGLNQWDDTKIFAPAFGNNGTPMILVVLDSKSPKILDARRLISSLPSDWPAVVVVLVSADVETLEGTRKTLTESLRRLFRVPADVPMVVSGTMDTYESRHWLVVAMAERDSDSGEED